uniref:Uncharacterized protein n=1 Tax=Tetranychus urticae TaxID=32264 RepID=T1KMU1_TETUR
MTLCQWQIEGAKVAAHVFTSSDDHHLPFLCVFCDMRECCASSTLCNLLIFHKTLLFFYRVHLTALFFGVMPPNFPFTFTTSDLRSPSVLSEFKNAVKQAAGIPDHANCPRIFYHFMGEDQRVFTKQDVVGLVLSHKNTQKFLLIEIFGEVIRLRTEYNNDD